MEPMDKRCVEGKVLMHLKCRLQIVSTKIYSENFITNASIEVGMPDGMPEQVKSEMAYRRSTSLKSLCTFRLLRSSAHRAGNDFLFHLTARTLSNPKSDIGSQQNVPTRSVLALGATALLLFRTERKICQTAVVLAMYVVLP